MWVELSAAVRDRLEEDVLEGVESRAAVALLFNADLGLVGLIEGAATFSSRSLKAENLENMLLLLFTLQFATMPLEQYAIRGVRVDGLL